MSIGEALSIARWACGRKYRYPTVYAAQKDQTVVRGETKPYRCPFCSGWHVGHPPSMEALGRIAEAIRVLNQEVSA